MWLFSWTCVKDNLIKYNCLSCNKDYSSKSDEELKKQFKDIFKFSNNDSNKSIFLLKKGVYSYHYMDDWEKFNKTALPEEFYKNLHMEDTTDVVSKKGL